jgi:hypothetical protein
MSGEEPAPQTTTSTSEPPAYLQPFLTQTATEAQKIYEAGGPSYYPGSTVVPMSSQTQQGLGQIQNLAMQGGQLTPAATQTLLSTIQGQGVNPFLGQAVQSATAPLYDEFNQNTIPMLQSIFARSGGTGGSAEGFGAERAATALGRGVAEQAGSLAYQSAEAERQRQLQATQLAPSMDAARYADAQAMLGVGGAYEAQSQAELQAQIDKYNYEQNLASMQLNQYIQQLTSTGGSGYGITTNTQAAAPQGSAVGGILGATATGAGIGGSIGGAPGAGIGAAVGMTAGELNYLFG